MDPLDTLKTLLELGWPAIVLVASFVLWRAYQARVNAQIQALEDQILYLRGKLDECEDETD